MTTSIVLVDASNVAHSTEGERPLLRNILAVREKLSEEGLEPIVVADAALRHQIDDTGGSGTRRYSSLEMAESVTPSP